MDGYPVVLTEAGHVEPVPRRIRAVVAGMTVLDTTEALYVWEWPHYPQYYVPFDDVTPGVLVAEGATATGPLGSGDLHAIELGEIHRPRAAKVFSQTSDRRLLGCVRFEWSSMDAWFEEEERVFVHPRSPYTRVDALRSSRTARVEVDGLVLAESSSPVLVFETGLPTRFYLNPTEVDFTKLVGSETVTACPYKGITSGYWSARVGDVVHHDLAWAYDFPTRQLAPIAGLIAFYNERVDLIVDGRRLERPDTHFSRASS